MEDFNGLSLPFRLIELNSGEQLFALECKEIRTLGSKEELSGTFEVIYKCNGMDCHFECDITIGNIYYFYLELDTAYDILFSKNAKAVLNNYNNDRTNIVFEFDDKCRCKAHGTIKNSSDQYRSSIEFTMSAERSEICDALVSIDKFLNELSQVKGDMDFF
ncbi:hypothetical protein [Ruminococcus sp.]|uniref:hypothetical protein n=1 Tax=Ruminococcus sp. TaxID=41978 RepID=UPI0025D830D2|nr:hypothetical protein [Ruminococcus sp.]MBQ8967214.1 hypothetical protein [Ruminococcus sp.]